MSKYLERFRKMFKDLNRYSFIEPLEFTPRAPATELIFKSIESKLGSPLDPVIRSFYKETNGLKIHWRIKRDLDIKESDKIRTKSSDYYVKIAEYVGDPFAFINIIPIQKSFEKRDWKELVIDKEQQNKILNGKSFSIDQIKIGLKPFDLLNKEIGMAFLFGQDNGTPKVILLSEGYSELDNSRLTDFESYIEMLLVTRGIVEARIKIFDKENNESDSPLIGDTRFWQEKFTPKLFTK